MKNIILILSIVSVCPISAWALDSLSYSGRLVNSNGSPVGGPVSLRFDLSSTNDSSTTLCSKTISGVPLSNGVFHVKLKFESSDCGGETLQNVMEAVPSGHNMTYQVTDTTNNRTYAVQNMYAVPSSYMANYAKNLPQMGALQDQVLKWDDTLKRWIPGVGGTGNGSVTTIHTGSGLVGGPITNSGTISVEPGGITNTHLAGGIDPAKLAGTRDGTNYLKGDNTWGAFATDVLNTVLNGFSAASSSVVIATDNILTAIGKLQGQATDLSNNKLDKTGGTLSVGTINGVPTPVFPDQIVNKQYVDDQLGGVTSSQWLDAAPHIYFNTGNVGVGTGTPGEKLDVVGNIAVTGRLRFKDSGSNYVELRAPVTTAGVTFILPATYGSNGQYLKTNGAGDLSWGTPTIDSSSITDGSIEDADVSASANIAQSKIANLTNDLAAKENGIPLGTAAQYWRGDKTWQTLNTDVVPEGATNKYYSNTLARGAISASSPISYNAGTGVIGMVAGTTGDLLQYNGSAWVPWAPNFLTSEADTLATVTGRGATTTTAVTLNGGARFPNFGIWNASGSVGIGTLTPRSTLEVVGGIQIGNDGVACSASKVGTLRYSSGNVQYCNGSNWLTFGVSGSGITDINGSSVGSHSFSVPGSTGTSPNWVTTPATGVHTLNIPMASGAGVTAGLLSKADYDAFTSKLGTSTSLAGDVSGAYNATSVDKIKGTSVTISSLTSGNLLRYNGTAWVNAMLGISDIPNLDAAKITTGVLPVARGGTNTSTLSGNRIMVSTPTAIVEAPALTNGQLLIGSTGNTPVAATITAGTGVTVTNSPGGITIAASGSGGTVTNVSGTAPISVATGTTTPVVSISQAGTSSNGYLSSTDWNTFNNKQDALAGTWLNGLYFPANGTETLAVTKAPVLLTDAVNLQALNDAISGLPASVWSTSGTNIYNNNTGNVGIGTNTPGEKLDVNGVIRSSYKMEVSRDGNSGLILVNSYREATNHSKIQLRGARGTEASGAHLLNNDILGEFRADAWTNGSTWSESGMIQVRADEAHSASSSAGRMEFFVTPSASLAFPATPNMVIKSSGNIGMGTSTPGAKLEVAGQVKITGGSPGAGKVLTSDASGLASWTTPSTGGISALTGEVTASGTGSVVATITNDAVTSGKILDGTIVNADIANSTITYAKLNIADGSIPVAKLVRMTCLPGEVITSDATLGFRCVADSATDSTKLPLAGGTMTGALTLAGAPTANLHAATKEYVDIAISGVASVWSTNGTNIYKNNSGNVGIGITSPLVPLHIQSTSTTTVGQLGITAPNLTTGNGTTFGIGKNWTPGEAFSIGYYHETAATDRYMGIQWFGESPTLVYTQGGNLGVGTTTPGAKLEVAGQVKITGGSPGAGKVLTSDATGLATWTTPAGGSGDFMKDGSVAMTGQFKAIDGNSTTPSITFAADTGTGFFRVGNYAIGLRTTSHGNLWSMGNSIISTQTGGAGISRTAGTETSPAFLFQGDANTGMFSPTQEVLAFTTNGLEKVRITSTGNVGIGTNNPGAKLEVAGQVKITGGSPGAGKVLTSDANGLATWESAAGADHLGNHTATQNLIMGSNWISGDGGAEGIFVDSSGNVGIGTSAPSAMLEVAGQVKITGGSPGLGKVLTSDANGLATWEPASGGVSGSGTATYIPKFTAAGTIGNSTILEDGSSRVGIGGSPSNYRLEVINNVNNLHGIWVKNSNNGTSSGSQIALAIGSLNNVGGNLAINGSAANADLANRLALFTQPTTVTGISIAARNAGQDVRFFTGGTFEKMRLDSSGNLLIGTTTANSMLTVAGVVTPSVDNTHTLGNATYRWAAVHAANGTIQTSDKRLKKDISELSLGEGFINSLNPVQYRWKDENGDNKIHFGFIAQDIDKKLRDQKVGSNGIVNYDKDADRFGVNYSELIAPMVKSIQELFQKVLLVERKSQKVVDEQAELKKEIERLKAENNKLTEENKQNRERLERIEKLILQKAK